MTAGGIRLELAHLPHGTPVINAGILIHLGGFKLFHTGDYFLEDPEEAVSYLQGLGLPDAEIDIAFAPYYLVTMTDYLGITPEGIAPGVVIPMHIDPFFQHSADRILENFPNAIIFSEGEMDSRMFILPGLTDGG